MARLIHAPTSSAPIGARLDAGQAPQSDRSMPILQIAINFVFGMPFLACLLLALRSNLWVGFRQLEVAGVSIAAVVWPMAACLGALWLGVSLLLGPVRAKRPAGALFVLAGSALIVLLGS